MEEEEAAARTEGDTAAVCACVWLARCGGVCAMGWVHCHAGGPRQSPTYASVDFCAGALVGYARAASWRLVVGGGEVHASPEHGDGHGPARGTADKARARVREAGRFRCCWWRGCQPVAQGTGGRPMRRCACASSAAPRMTSAMQACGDRVDWAAGGRRAHGDQPAQGC